MNNVSQKPFKKIEASFLLAGAVIVVLIVLFFVYFPWPEDGEGKPADIARPDRTALLEDRLSQVEATIARLGEQANRFERHVERIGTMEEGLTLKIKQVSDEVDRLKQNAGPATVKPAAPAKPLAAKTVPAARYHEVKPNETLYSIGRAYGTTVGELRRRNNLSPKDVIHVGQKLKVGPVK